MHFFLLVSAEGPAHTRIFAAVDRFQRPDGTALRFPVWTQGHCAVSDFLCTEQHRQHDRQRNVSMAKKGEKQYGKWKTFVSGNRFNRKLYEFQRSGGAAGDIMFVE